MAIGHIAIRPHSRRAGRSAAAALAYRAGQRLLDPAGRVHNYVHRRRCEELVAAGVNSPKRWRGGANLQLLANAIEVAEKRRDARLLRDIQVAIPHELGKKQGTKLAKTFARALRKRYDTPVAWAVHRPRKGGCQCRSKFPQLRRSRNPHFIGCPGSM